MIGFRWQVGGDWGNYLRVFMLIQGLSLQEALDQTRYEPGYILLNFLSSWSGWEVYGVNVICAAIFSLGLIIFCSTLPYPRLAIAAATPYLIIVVAMGYTRQSVALGFEMMALVALSRKSIVWFVIWLLLGATFHKSVVALIPLVALVNARKWIWSGLWGAIALLTSYFVLFSDAAGERLIKTYVDTAAITSSGGLIRTLMNAIPALLLLVWRRRFTNDPGFEPDRQVSCIRLSDKTSRLRPRHVVPKPTQAYEPEVPVEVPVEVREWIAPAPSSPDVVLEAQPPAEPRRRVGIKRPIRLAESAYERLWFWMAIISLILMIGAATSPSSSTAIDRMALYFLPIQLFVFSNLPKVIANNYGEKVIMAGVVAYYGLVQLVWLNFADNAWAWLPYNSMFFAGEATR